MLVKFEGVMAAVVNFQFTSKSEQHGSERVEVG